MDIVKTFEKMSKWPLGREAFTLLVCQKAPYFSSIAPRVRDLRHGHIEIELKKRRAVTNHLGTVHAIAICNLAEMCAGLCIEGTLDWKLRWIPKGMSVQYLKKAGTNLLGKCTINDGQLQEGDNEIRVEVFDLDQQMVLDAKINMYVTKRTER